jgi:hypothetical protein
VLELAEEALDEIALPVELWVDGSLELAILLCGDAGDASGGGDEIDDGLGVIASIGDEQLGGRQTVDQVCNGGLVGSLSRRQQDADRQAILVDQRVDLGAQSSTRTADGVIRAPLLPPAACWWARMIELSIRCIDCGEAAASASNTRSQTPAFDHRL